MDEEEEVSAPPTRRRLFRDAAALAGAFAASRVAARAAGPASPGPGPELRAQRLAWAGVRLELGRDALCLDPLVSPGVWGTALRDPLIPVEPAEGARFALVTHRHPDHFDPAAVRRALGDSGTLVCSPETAALAAGQGFRVRPAPLYEPLLLADFTAIAVPALDGYGDPQVSWVVSGGGRRILHGGDTLWHGSWWHIGRGFGPFDAAFLPINGARFGWRKPVAGVPSVMTPEQAVAAAAVVEARLLVPIHYGLVEAESYNEVPGAEAALLEAARRRGVDVEIVRPGEWLTWRPRKER